ncbi:conserved protein, unknown function, partial [Hepatocystis sp. ex Piliocolobus tephrosceles]
KLFKNFLVLSRYIKYDSDKGDKYKQLLHILSQDISYKRLDCVPDDRENIIKERIVELKKEHDKNKNLAERLKF